MARKKPADPTKDAIEVQCRRLRDLALEMRAYGEGRKGGRLFVSWAATIVTCAEELERAVADGDEELRDKALGWAVEIGKFVAKVAITAGVTLGVNSALSGPPPADAERLLECASRVVEQAEMIDELRRTSEPTASGSGGGGANRSGGTPFDSDTPFDADIPFDGEGDVLTTEDGDVITTEDGDRIGLEGPSPAAAAEEALQGYGGGFEGNRVQYGERDENNRPRSTGNVELPESSVVENLGYVDSDLASVGPGQPEKSLRTLQIRKLMGLRLRELRQLLGRTLEQVAEDYVVSVPRIANIESGYTNQDDLNDYVGAIQRSKRFQGAGPKARELMDEIVSLLEQSRPS